MDQTNYNQFNIYHMILFIYLFIYICVCIVKNNCKLFCVCWSVVYQLKWNQDFTHSCWDLMSCYSTTVLVNLLRAQAGFTGPHCEVNINDCEVNPCQNEVSWNIDNLALQDPICGWLDLRPGKVPRITQNGLRKTLWPAVQLGTVILATW